MTYESVGHFIMYATAGEKKRMANILQSIKPYQTVPILTGVVFSTSRDASMTLPQHLLRTRLWLIAVYIAPTIDIPNPASPKIFVVSIYSSMSIVQSILFKREYGLTKARSWLSHHGFGTSKIDVTPEHIRFRQYDPKHLEAMGYKFRTKKFAHGSFIIAYPPAKK